MDRRFKSTALIWRNIQRKAQRAIYKYGEYAIKHWPWKIVFAPLASLALVLFCFLIYIPQEEGGWVKMWRTRREWRRKRSRLEFWQPQPLRRAEDLSIMQKMRRFRARRRRVGMSPQYQSRLFRLPIELRQRILSLVLQSVSHRLHVQQSYRRFGYTQCHFGDMQLFPHINVLNCLWDQLDHTTEERPRSYSRFVLWSDEHLVHMPSVLSREHCTRRSNQLLSTALSCKRGAQEFLPLLYSQSSFSFTSLSQFWLWSRTIQAHNLQAIRHLEFHIQFGSIVSHEHREDMSNYDPNSYGPSKRQNPWTGAWNVIKEMSSLRSLKLEVLCEYMDDRPRVSTKWIEERIFEPMKDVHSKSLREFVVIVNWPPTDGFQLGLVGFELERCVDQRQRIMPTYDIDEGW